MIRLYSIKTMSLTQKDLIKRAIEKIYVLKVKNKKSKRIEKVDPNLRYMNRKTHIFNFYEICKSFNRTTENEIQHVKKFIEKKENLKSSIDGSNNLIIVGSVRKPKFDKLMKDYVKAYIMCASCKSPDTYIEKDNRLYNVKCHKCKEIRCVQL
jgi:translation initiation factor 2 beta subunit (eIF-2beta)/eIF-5